LKNGFLKDVRARGAALALLSAFTYGSSLVLSATAFEYGMAPLTMTVLRFFSVVVVLGIFLTMTRGFVPILTLPGRHAIGIGAFHFAANLMLMIAVTLAPVSISIVLFYMFPAVVLMLSSLLDRKAPELIEIITVVIAIAGVALTVRSGGSDGAISAFGIVLALAAAIAVSLMMIGTQRLLKGQDSVGVTFNLALTSVVLGVFATVVSGVFALPNAAEGYLILAGVLVLYPIALTCAVLAIGLAFKGETLTPQQICGVTMVLSAIGFLQWQRLRRARKNFQVS